MSLKQVSIYQLLHSSQLHTDLFNVGNTQKCKSIEQCSFRWFHSEFMSKLGGTSCSSTVCFFHQKLERKAEHKDCLILQVFQDMIYLQCQLKRANQVDAGVLVLKTTYTGALMNGENHGSSKKTKQNKNKQAKKNKESLTMRNCSYLNNSIQILKAIASCFQPPIPF